MTCEFIGHVPRAVGASDYIARNFAPLSYWANRRFGPPTWYVVPKGRVTCRLNALLEAFNMEDWTGTTDPSLSPSVVQFELVTVAGGLQTFELALDETGYNAFSTLVADLPDSLTEGERIFVKGRTDVHMANNFLTASFAGVEHDDDAPPGRYGNILLTEHIVETVGGFPTETRIVTVPSGATVLNVTMSNPVGFVSGDFGDGGPPAIEIYDPGFNLFGQDYSGQFNPGIGNNWTRYGLAVPVGPLGPFLANGSGGSGYPSLAGGPGDWEIDIYPFISAPDHTIEFDLEISYATGP